jgi:outer membrane protein assembly factor BamB
MPHLIFPVGTDACFGLTDEYHWHEDFSQFRRGINLMKNRAIFSNSLFVFIAAFGLLFTLFAQGCSSGAPADKARNIISQSGVQGGFIVHLNCGDGVLTEALKAGDNYIVQGLDPGLENVQKAREYIASRQEYGPISVDRLRGNRLPYKDNLVNLVVAEDLGDVTMDEVNRVLAPNGVAMTKGTFGWEKTVKPTPEELDEWNQYLYDAGGNMVSKDESVGPVKHYQWIGSPRWGRHHDTVASMSAMVSASGRIFYILDEGPKESIQLPAENFLVARDAYNGTIFWKRKLPDWQNHLFALKSGPAYLPRRLIAIEDRVYVTLGINAGLSQLDAATGETIRTFPNTEGTSEVIFSDGTLFLLIGYPEKNRDKYAPKITNVWDAPDWARSEWGWNREPRMIRAIKTANGEALWTAEYPVAPLSLTADSDSVYFYDGTKMICLNRLNGQENWQSGATQSRAIDTAYAPRIVAYEDVVLFSSGLHSMTAFSTEDGKKLWEAPQDPSGYYTPEDMFVIDDLVWSGDTTDPEASGLFTGRDLHTGKAVVEIPCEPDVFWFHQRCYPNKATENYIIPSRTGIEFVDLEQKKWTVNHYTRGGCLYGVMPSNGLVYTPPHACACYMEAKLSGFCALAPAGGSTLALDIVAAGKQLEKGPAYDAQIRDDAGNEDWPTFRHDSKRSSYTTSSVSVEVQPQWRTRLGGKLSSPVVAGNRVYVAKVDAHAVYAIDAAAGDILWAYTTGGRVDSPPTIYQGRVLFGSADGYVYCLNAADGSLIWRFRAAPMDQRMMAFEQVESVWPVHGSVLIQDDKVYCVAGRSVFLDGGMRLLQLDPRTGEKLSENVLDEIDPETGKNLHEYVQRLNMPVGLPDILSSDGEYIYMRSQQFDLDGNRKHIGVRNVNDQTGRGAHVFSPVGFLDDAQFSRSYMMYGKSVSSGWGSWEVMGRLTPSGRLIAVDDEKIYGYARKPEFLSESMVLEYHLYAAAKSSDPEAIKKANPMSFAAAKPKVQPVATQKTSQQPSANRLPKQQSGAKPDNKPEDKMFRATGDWRLRQELPQDVQSALNFQWKVDKPDIQVRAMVLADKTLFIAGPPDIVDEEEAFFALSDTAVLEQLAEQSALLKGKEGAFLWAVSAQNGRKLAEYKLDSLPVWDGMIASGRKLYLTTMNGEISCMSGAGK